MAEIAEDTHGFGPLVARAWIDADATAHFARELHDGVAGELSAMLLDLERFRHSQVGRQGVLSEINHLQEQVRSVLANVRAILNDQRGLPGVDPDLIGSLRRHLVRRFAERTGLRIHLSVSRRWPSSLPAETARQLHRIVQEALNNVERHSGAGSVLIRFDLTQTGGVLKVLDDGSGYATSEGKAGGLGLLGIEERAALLGARVVIGRRPRGGTALSIAIPRRSLGL